VPNLVDQQRVRRALWALEEERRAARAHDAVDDPVASRYGATSAEMRRARPVPLEEGEPLSQVAGRHLREDTTWRRWPPKRGSWCSATLESSAVDGAPSLPQRCEGVVLDELRDLARTRAARLALGLEGDDVAAAVRPIALCDRSDPLLSSSSSRRAAAVVAERGRRSRLRLGPALGSEAEDAGWDGVGAPLSKASTVRSLIAKPSFFRRKLGSP